MAKYQIVLTSSVFALALGLVSHAAPAHAQEPDAATATAGDEIVVIARKRAESLQDVPLSVTAVNEAFIERNNITKIDQVAAVTPNVQLQPISVNPTNIAPYIRGVGSRSQEPSQEVPVAISIDGVYLSQIAGSLVDVFDVEQIEVLRGPQGTLEGRNSSGGAINVRTRRPTGKFGARTEVAFERFDRVDFKAMVEAPLAADVLAAKVSGFYAHGGGYMKVAGSTKELGGVDTWGGRIGFLFTPSDTFTAYLTADYVRDTSPQPAIRVRAHSGAVAPNQPQAVVCSVYGVCSEQPKYRSEQNFLDNNSSKNGGFGLNADWELGPVTLTSVTGYRFINEINRTDVDATRFVILESRNRDTDVRQFSQEVRLASNDKGPFEYVVGAYFIRSKFDLEQPLTLGGAIFGSPVDIVANSRRVQVAKSFALFGQGTYHISDAWSVSGGIRQTWDRKQMDSTPNLTGAPTDIVGHIKAKFDKLTIEAGTEYELDPDKLAYFRFAQGYRAGGINGDAPAIDLMNVYKPETINSFEVGLKTQWLDRRLTFNISGFIYDYKDIQILAVDSSARAVVQRVVNGKGAKVKGVEVESTLRATDQLTFTGSLGYLDAQYKSDMQNLGFGNTQLRDVRREYTPHWTGYLGFDYVVPVGGGEVVLAGDVNYKSSMATSPIDNPISNQPRYALANASLTYRAEDGRYAITVFGRNLTDKYYKTTGETGGGFFIWDAVGKPLTYGVRLATKF